MFQSNLYFGKLYDNFLITRLTLFMSYKNLLTIGVIFSFSLSMSPCSKNSDDTNSATLFSTSQGFVMAARSQTVISMALNSSLCSSMAQQGPSPTTLKKAPRFLQTHSSCINMKSQLDRKVLRVVTYNLPEVNR